MQMSGPCPSTPNQLYGSTLASPESLSELPSRLTSRVSKRCSRSCLRSRVVLSLKAYRQEAHLRDRGEQTPGSCSPEPAPPPLPAGAPVSGLAKPQTPGGQAGAGQQRPPRRTAGTENKHHLKKNSVSLYYFIGCSDNFFF